MAKIIFEYTKSSRYAAQGGSPSGREGYNVWIQYPDDDMVHFLGFCTKEEVPNNVRYYLDNGKKVTLADTNECCAYTELSSFLWNAEKIDHIITGVRTEEGYTKWSIFADMSDILTLSVGWSCGNPFYYGYGFEIGVEDCEPNND